MASGRRFLRPVRMPVPPHPHEEPQAVLQAGGSSSQAAGRGPGRSGRAASSRALRRVSSTTTFAGRGACLGRAATRTRCRCISCLLSVVDRCFAAAPSGRPGRLLPSKRQACQGSNPDQRGWSSLCSRYTTGLRKRTARIERASPEWRPGALPSELRPRDAPPVPGVSLAVPGRRGQYSNTAPESPVPRAARALGGTGLRPAGAERGQGREEPPAGFEPTPRPYKGRVLAVDTTEA
jgi:hypothetical protein